MKGNLTPPKVNNSVIIYSNNKVVDDISEIQKNIIRMISEFKGETNKHMNEFKEHINKQLNVIKKTMQDMKEEFNKDT
jgi:gas vesicle protein